MCECVTQQSEKGRRGAVGARGDKPKIAGVSDDTLPMSRSIWMMRLMRLAGNAPAADFRRRVRAPAAPSAAPSPPPYSLIRSLDRKKMGEIKKREMDGEGKTKKENKSKRNKHTRMSERAVEDAPFPASAALVSALYDAHTQGAALLARSTAPAPRRTAVCRVLASFLRIVESALTAPDTPPASRPQLVCFTLTHTCIHPTHFCLTPRSS